MSAGGVSARVPGNGTTADGRSTFLASSICSNMVFQLLSIRRDCKPSTPKSLLSGRNHCASTVDTYNVSWDSPADACATWATNSDWGAIQGNATLSESCAESWAQANCAATCCACEGLNDTYAVDWGSPSEACAQWANSSSWGAEEDGDTLATSCAGSWGQANCAATCCAKLGGPQATVQIATSRRKASASHAHSHSSAAHQQALMPAYASTGRSQEEQLPRPQSPSANGQRVRSAIFGYEPENEYAAGCLEAAVDSVAILLSAEFANLLWLGFQRLFLKAKGDLAKEYECENPFFKGLKEAKKLANPQLAMLEDAAMDGVLGCGLSSAGVALNGLISNATDGYVNMDLWKLVIRTGGGALFNAIGHHKYSGEKLDEYLEHTGTGKWELGEGFTNGACLYAWHTATEQTEHAGAYMHYGAFLACDMFTKVVLGSLRQGYKHFKGAATDANFLGCKKKTTDKICEENPDREGCEEHKNDKCRKQETDDDACKSKERCNSMANEDLEKPETKACKDRCAPKEPPVPLNEEEEHCRKRARKRCKDAPNRPRAKTLPSGPRPKAGDLGQVRAGDLDVDPDRCQERRKEEQKKEEDLQNKCQQCATEMRHSVTSEQFSRGSVAGFATEGGCRQKLEDAEKEKKDSEAELEDDLVTVASNAAQPPAAHCPTGQKD